MERLTCKFNELTVLREMCTFDRESTTEPDDCIACGEICEENEIKCETCPIQQAFDKLSDYEDTGLTPDQIREIDKKYAELEVEVQQYQAIGNILAQGLEKYFGGKP